MRTNVPGGVRVVAVPEAGATVDLGRIGHGQHPEAVLHAAGWTAEAPVSATVAQVFGEGERPAGVEPLVGDALLEAVRDGLAEEIALMLEEGVVEQPEQVDLALILGAGFPRHRGGVTPYLDASGASQRVLGRTFHGELFTHRG